MDDEPGWAGEFRAVRDESTTALERDILADDRITVEERVAAEDAFVTCAAQQGFVVSDFVPGGGYSIDGPFTDAGPPGLQACEASLYRTSGLFWMIQRNPEGDDEVGLMVDCLTRAGLLDDDFTAAEYEAQLGEGGLGVETREFRLCNADPTHAFSE